MDVAFMVPLVLSTEDKILWFIHEMTWYNLRRKSKGYSNLMQIFWVKKQVIDILLNDILRCGGNI